VHVYAHGLTATPSEDCKAKLCFQFSKKALSYLPAKGMRKI